MNTTATAQVRCGNHGAERVYHPTSADVRACYQGRTAAQPAAPSQPAPRTAEDSRNDAIARLANQKSPFFQDRNMGRSYPASEKQASFLRDLAAEVLLGEARDALLAKLDAEQVTSAQAKQLITDMLVMRGEQRKLAATQPKAAATTARSVGNRYALLEQVMQGDAEANFCVTDEDGKSRFYRISKRGKNSRRPGTWKIQERVSDDLFPRSDSMLATVAQMVIDQGGPAAAGKRYAERMHACYKCGRTLTDDTGNPYYAQGIGPDCGSK